MNKHCYRIIFNRQKDQLIVVSELANRHNNAVTSSSPTTPTSQTVSQTVTTTLRPFYLMFCMVFSSTFLIGSSFANIIADKSAPENQRPEIMQSSNGISQVNIQTPGKDGISHNKYSQFDVDQKGAILNNASLPTKTELAGYVLGNPNLANSGAKIILNEVNASNPSQLNGFIEVAGGKAQVIIANASGIDCEGCGFINADKTTLTTGKPQMENGQLKGYNVQQGKIRILGKGLNSKKQNYTEIIARSVEANAGIWGNDIKVITGRNQVSADLNTITANNDNEKDKPQFAIDVAELGGIYADKIHLVGTEKGVGVSNAGQLGGGAGSINVTANGKIVNNGLIQAKQHIELTSEQDIENNNQINSQQNINLNTGKQIVNNGLLRAGKNITLIGKTVNSTINGTISAGMNETQNGNITVKGDDIVLHGHNTANNTLAIQANNNINLDGSTSYADKIDIAGKTLSLQQANLQSDKVFSLSNLSEINSSYSTITAKEGISFESDRLTNDHSKLTAEGDIQLIAKQLENNQSDIATNNNLQIDADTIQSQNAKLSAKGNIQLNADQITADNIDIITEKTLSIDTKQLSTIAGRLQSKQKLEIKANDYYHADNVNIITEDELIIESPSITSNQSGISALGLLSIDAKSLQNQRSFWLSDNDINVKADTINNQSSLMKATHGIDFTFNTLNNDNAQFTSGGEVKLSGIFLINPSAYITAQGNLSIEVKEKIDNQKSQLYSNKSININSDDIDNHEAIIIADENLNLKSNKLNNQQAQIKTGGDLAIELSDQLKNENAKLISGKAITINAQTILNQQALLSAGQQIYLETQSINNKEGNIQSQDNITLIAESFDNQFAKLIAGIGGISITAPQWTNNEASLLTTGELTLNSEELDNTKATLVGERGISIKAKQVTNQQGELKTKGYIDIIADKLINAQATLFSESDINLKINDDFGNEAAQLTALGRITLSSNDIVCNKDAQIESGNGIEITSNALHNGLAKLTTIGDLIIHSGYIDNYQASLTANNIDITANDFENDQGQLLANNIKLSSNQLNNYGTIKAQNDIELTLFGSLLNQNEIIANGNLSISTFNYITNLNKMVAGNNLSLTSTKLENDNYSEISANNLVIDNSELLNNGLIDGNTVSIKTTNLKNLTTGRIYGDDLTIQTELLHNQANNDQAPAIIAARKDFKLGVQTLNNSGHGRLLSLGNFTIGGQIDQNGQVINQAQSIDNYESTIESNGDLQLNVNQLNNTNDHVKTKDELSNEAPENENYFLIDGQTIYYKVDELEYMVDRGTGSKYVSWSELNEDERQKSTFTHIKIKATGEQSNRFYHYNYQTNKYNTVIVDPPSITATNNITINGDKITNKNSKIMAGNELTLNVKEKNTFVETIQKIISRGYRFYHYFDIGTSSGGGSRGHKIEKSDYYQQTEKTIPELADKNISDHQPIQPSVLDSVTRTPANVAIIIDVPDLNYNIDVNIENQFTQDEIALTGSNIDDSHLSAQNNKVEDLTPISITNPIIDFPNLGVKDKTPEINYVTETDPRFTDIQKWLSSDYMQNILKPNPDQTQKRLSDGYHEQQVIRDQQINALFNQQDLGTHQNNLKKYQKIINSGIEFARPYEISIGAKLSAGQMSVITSDIVSNVSHNIILDGKNYQVLVPQSYLITGSPISVDNGFLTSKNSPKHNTWDFLNNNEMISSEKNVNTINANNPNQASSMELDIITGNTNGIIVGLYTPNLDEISEEQHIDKNEKDKILYQENEEPKSNKIDSSTLDIEVVKLNDNSSPTDGVKPVSSENEANLIENEPTNKKPVKDLAENEKSDINVLNLLAEGLNDTSGNSVDSDISSTKVVENKTPVKNNSTGSANSSGLGVLSHPAEENHSSTLPPAVIAYLTQQKLDQLFKDQNSGKLFKDITFDKIFKERNADILIYDPIKNELKKVPPKDLRSMNPNNNYLVNSAAETLEDYFIAAMGVLPFGKYIKFGGKMISVEAKTAQSLIKEAQLARQQLKQEQIQPMTIIKKATQLLVQDMVFMPTQLKLIPMVIPYTQIISLIILLNTV